MLMRKSRVLLRSVRCVVHPAGINPDNLGGIGAFDGEIDAEASLLRVFAAAGVVVRVHG